MPPTDPTAIFKLDNVWGSHNALYSLSKPSSIHLFPLLPPPFYLGLRGGGEDQTARSMSQSSEEEPWHGFAVEDIFQSHPKSLEVSDNPIQTSVIRHHYWNEFGKHISMTEVLKDYADDCVIHTVINGTPASYHGHDGVKNVFKDLYRRIPHDSSHFELEHIAVNHDHAQVVWKARLQGDPVDGTTSFIRGTDSFAFDSADSGSRIKHQTTVALTWSQTTDQSYADDC